MKKAAWDQTRARELLAEGKTDLEIADMVGASLGAVRSWRIRAGLPCNPAKKGPIAARKKPEAQEPTQVSTPVSAPLAAPSGGRATLPGALEPVEISFSYNGSAVTLTAPNLAGARWAGQYLQQLLTDLERVLP